MSMETFKINEDLPETYPEVDGLSVAAAELDSAFIWQRIEAYVAWRWTPRAVVWTVQGGGDWEPPLSPVLIEQVYFWNSNGWTEFVPDFGPLGYILPEGMCKVEVTAGLDTSAPAAVLEAYRRLAEYMAQDAGTAGASSEKEAIAGLSEEVSRNPAWMARAIQNSGAADLLRPYRRA